MVILNWGVSILRSRFQQALAAGLLGIASGCAQAQTQLVSTNPANHAVLARSPGWVRLTFSAPVSLKAAWLRDG